jgi:DNA mismatch repair protein MutL
MNRIRLLPEQVANQIAAGEVVERPASVVKELVENAIDAGATRVTIEIQGGGRQLIRVADDGAGMSRDDALLCLERHATSKIRSATDLTAITSMGFRGEALPSIASVSRFTLTTRERDSAAPEATQILVQGGRLADVREVGHPPGTTVEVRQLFHNLPARRKFLRSEETERAHIIHYLTLAALAHPEVGFVLRQEDRTVWQLPAMSPGGGLAEAVRDRLRALLGSDLPLLTVEQLNPLPAGGGADEDLQASEEDASPTTLRVWGFVGAPGVSRSTRQDQHLFVNRRPVENRALNFALLEGYHTALMKGRYPIACLFIEIDPAEVDVNVHPAKREVRFRREPAVRGAVTAAVRRALLDHHHPGALSAPTGKGLRAEPAIPRADERPPVPPAELPAAVEPLFPTFAHRPAPGWAGAGRPFPASEFEADPAPAAVMPLRSGSDSDVRVDVQVPTPGSGPLPGATPATGPAGDSQAEPLLQVALRLVGVVGKLYVVFESDRGLVLMDQHAAHERVLYEQMLRRLEQGDAPSQRLLLPETVELSVRDALFVREHLANLVRLGVGLSEFGDRTFLLDALPPFVRVVDARQFVRDLIDELMVAGREVNALRLGEQTVAKTVCRHAVKAHDPLAEAELEQLVADLRCCSMPYTCPHGRPTLIEMNFKELERKFGRIPQLTAGRFR